MKDYGESIISEIILLYNSGMSVFVIRNKMKMDKKNIKKILIENNVWIENRDKRKQLDEYSDNEINEIILLYQKGNSVTQIETISHHSKKFITKILIKNNVFIKNRDDLKIMFSEEDILKIKNMYLIENLNTRKIGDYFNCSNTPIKNLLRSLNILRKGNSDGKMVSLNEKQKEDIINLYVNEYESVETIEKILSLGSGVIRKFLVENKLMRNRSEGVSVGLIKRWGVTTYKEYLKTISEYEKYRKVVIKITNKQPIQTLENYEKRGVSGKAGAYNLDHKYSISEGFFNKIDPQMIGSINNLEFIPWKDNMTKRTKCSITKEELLKLVLCQSAQ